MKLDPAQNWQLFGYDVRHLGAYWKSAWRDLLWSHDSPVRRRLDDCVALVGEEGTTCYQGGEPVAGVSASCDAVLLPDSLVLGKTLNLPLAAEQDLDAVLALEVSASSPFAPDDTGYGWRVVARDEAQIAVKLAIVSRSAVMTYLARQYDSHDPQAQEVWALLDGSTLVLSGFGENRRNQLYRRRLLRVGGLLVASLLIVLLMAVLAGAMKGLERRNVAAELAAVEQRAVESARRRESLVEARELLAAANALVRSHPSPHVELARLTRLLGDDAWLGSFAMDGAELQVHGWSVDAAAVMRQLAEEPAYAAVDAPRAISRLATTGLDQFYLDIRLAEGTSQ